MKNLINYTMSYLIAFAMSIAVPVSALSAEENSDMIGTDDSITDIMHAQIEHDPYFSGATIDVSTQNGIVTLEGVASSLYEKHRAVEWASSLRGVKSVINRITVRPVSRTSMQLREDIREELSLHPVLEKSGIQVRMIDDTVAVLTGGVQSRVEKNFAEDMASTVPGVSAIDNQIRITPVENRPDKELAAEIKHRLDHDVYVDARHLVIHVEDGHVSFTGPVISLADKRRVEDLAWVNGVRRVDTSDITVDWNLFGDLEDDKTGAMVYRDSEAILDSVQLSLQYDPRVNAESIVVHVTDGVVTLTGIVHSLEARQSAAQTVRNTAGVVDIDNHLVVRASQYESAQVLVELSENALERSPYVDREDIAVMADGMTVYLSGQVDTPFEREQATIVIERIPGVEKVENLVTTEFESREFLSSLHRTITNQLDANPFLNENHVDVTVVGESVELRGDVDSLHEKRYVELIAYSSGADDVDNYLVIDKPVK